MLSKATEQQLDLESTHFFYNAWCCSLVHSRDWERVRSMNGWIHSMTHTDSVTCVSMI